MKTKTKKGGSKTCAKVSGYKTKKKKTVKAYARKKAKK